MNGLVLAHCLYTVHSHVPKKAELHSPNHDNPPKPTAYDDNQTTLRSPDPRLWS